MDYIKAESLTTEFFCTRIIAGVIFLSLVITEVSWELEHVRRKIELCGGMISSSLCSIYNIDPCPAFTICLESNRD